MPQLTPTLPMDLALDSEILRLERLVARGGLITSGLGVLLSGYIALTLNPQLGWPLVGFALCLVGWFIFVKQALDRGRWAKAFQWLNPLVEISLPTVLTVLDARLLGSAYAASQSAPLQFYGVMIVLAVLRLKPYMPLLVGSVAAVQYALAYTLVIAPGLSLELQQSTALRWEMVLIRCVLLVLAGGLASLVSRALRTAAHQANAEVRSQELFGKYRLGPHLASGGMGEVFKATYCPEGGFERPVALKRIHPHLARDGRFVDRFRNEASLSSRLVHRNIVQVMDFGRIVDTWFLAMEYVEGMTLDEVIDRAGQLDRPLPGGLVALIGLEIAQGLAYAHEVARDEEGKLLRIVHRDLTPSNVLLSRAGEVKILDFGVARALHEASRASTQTLTGKVAYLAPEQVENGDIEPRSDLFSLGITLWELLCGESLFQRQNEATTLVAVLSAPIPRPSSRRPDLYGTGWDELLAKALERVPELRFPSAEAFRDALEELLEQVGRPHPDALSRYLAELGSGGRVSPLSPTQTPTLLEDALPMGSQG